MSFFVVIEGSDCSGKSTQLSLLKETLNQKSIEYNSLSFPRYDNKSSTAVKMYLNGEMGSRPSDVGAYAASTLFAVDRFASFKTEWEKLYLDDKIFLVDRYTTSNAIHQASKLDGKEKNEYLDWLFDFEYRLLGLPKPDLVIFLDMPTEFAVKLLSGREDQKKDIHELDSDYLKKCYDTSKDICQNYNWHRISCVNDGALRTIEDIHEEILSIVLENLK